MPSSSSWVLRPRVIRRASTDEGVTLVLEVDRTVDFESGVPDPVVESMWRESVIEGWSLLTGSVGLVLADEEARLGGQCLREFSEQSFVGEEATSS